MKNRAMICRALSGHALEVVGPIVVLKNNERRITFYCARCDSYRSDTWSLNGRVISKRYYRLSKEYQAFVKGHDRAQARESLLGTLKETSREDYNASLRSVQGAKQARNRNVRPVKRTKDKRRVA